MKECTFENVAKVTTCQIMATYANNMASLKKKEDCMAEAE